MNTLSLIKQLIDRNANVVYINNEQLSLMYAIKKLATNFEDVENFEVEFTDSPVWSLVATVTEKKLIADTMVEMLAKRLAYINSKGIWLNDLRIQHDDIERQYQEELTTEQKQLFDSFYLQSEYSK